MATKGLFFWRKKELSREEKIKELSELMAEASTLKYGINATQGVEQSISGSSLDKLYDFYQTYYGSPMPIQDFPANPNQLPPTDERIVATPLSVLKELHEIPSPVNCTGLDEKISQLESKTSLTNQHYSLEQIKNLIVCLNNRKRYAEFQDFYIKFPYTNDENIETLLKKYKLEMKTTDLFIPTFPKEADEVIKAYTEKTKELTGKLPVLYVIADVTDFKKKYARLDPILLAQSPFGFFWQILGAWDKEMLLLSEL